MSNNQAKKILVVDDDEGILEVTKMILEDNGYIVSDLNNSSMVEKEVESFKPDLVLLDVWMPDISGEEICYRLKGDNKTKNIPIIILSASFKTESISRNCGANGYLEKPFDIDKLLEVVSKNLVT